MLASFPIVRVCEIAAFAFTDILPKLHASTTDRKAAPIVTAFETFRAQGADLVLFQVRTYAVIPDEYEKIKEKLLALTEEGISLILTTGGLEILTGGGHRDHTK